MSRMLPTAFRRALRALAIATPGLGQRLARRSWPQTQGQLPLPGLEERVEILRDRYGVPHLYASSEADLFFAQGVVHAQDRPWQLELGRRMASGTLSQVLGPGALPVDKAMRAFGLRRLAAKDVGQLDAESLAILESYCRGLNAWLAQMPRLPYEFQLLEVPPPAPFTPLDVMLRANMLALLLGGNYRLELLSARIRAEVGEEVAALLLPAHAPDSPRVVPSETRQSGLGRVPHLKNLDALDAVLGDPNIVSGSNNWVVDGHRTASGRPLLANDIHMGLHLPANLYEVGLHGGRFQCVGFSLPGVPMLIMGHNGHIAWGLSNLGPDTQDFYQEKLDSLEQPTRYRFKEDWLPLEVTKERIEVKGQAPQVMVLRSTHHGTLMNEAMSDELKDEAPMALCWSLPSCRPLVPALVQLNLARDWEGFRAALALWDAPGQNMVYADTAGNIGFQATGKIPIRAASHGGATPVPGWTGAFEWQGWIPFEALPTSLNPTTGFAASANNKLTEDDYPYYLAAHWFPGYRARRIVDCLEAGERLTVEDMHGLQRDTFSIPAERLTPLLLDAARPVRPLEKEAHAALQGWDLRFEVGSRGATIFEACYLTLLRRILRRVLSPGLAHRYLVGDYERHGSLHMPLVLGLLEQEQHAFFGRDAAAGTVSRARLLEEVFTEAVGWLETRYGPRVEGWRWGKVHPIRMVHSPLGRTGPGWLRAIFNSPALEGPGENYTVDGASFLWSDPFAAVHGTVARMVIDLADLEKSQSLLLPGQSEHLFHAHRSDQLELSAARRLHPMPFSRQAVEQHACHRLVLEPAP